MAIIGHTNKCEFCGKIFIADGYRQYCHECAKAASQPQLVQTKIATAWPEVRNLLERCGINTANLTHGEKVLSIKIDFSGGLLIIEKQYYCELR